MGVAAEARRLGRPRDPASPHRVRLPGVCVLGVGAARLGFPRPPFCGFRENTGVPCPVGGGGRGGGMIPSILSLRSKGKCAQQLLPSTCGQSGPSFARTRAGRGRFGRPGAVGRRLDPRALLGRRRQIPAARERREPPGTSPKAQVSPRTRVQQLKEPRRKRKMRWRRGEGAGVSGCGLRQR